MTPWAFSQARCRSTRRQVAAVEQPFQLGPGQGVVLADDQERLPLLGLEVAAARAEPDPGEGLRGAPSGRRPLGFAGPGSRDVRLESIRYELHGSGDRGPGEPSRPVASSAAQARGPGPVRLGPASGRIVRHARPDVTTRSRGPSDHCASLPVRADGHLRAGASRIASGRRSADVGRTAARPRRPGPTRRPAWPTGSPRPG